jgi:cell wall-associated NlpC family hydrolase
VAAITGPATGNPVAAAAEQCIGPFYVYGGAPATGRGHWDCSSMVNWVVGHQLGMAIPGFAAGTYTGAGHGPDTIAWASWPGAAHVASPAPGDIVIWAGAGAHGHMGIVTGNDQMVSALNAREGTRKTRIQGTGPAGVPLVYRRLNGAGSGAPGAAAVPAGCLPGARVAVALIAMFHRR